LKSKIVEHIVFGVSDTGKCNPHLTSTPSISP
jgi:hypothetical protein